VSGARAAIKVAAILGAAAMASPLVVEAEGWVLKTYRDPIGLVTDCAGNTKGAVMGTVRTDAECQRRLIDALVEHGQDIDPCITADIPLETRAAFTSFAYNVGAAKACSSTMFRKANAGDVAGSCAELSRWTYAGTRVLPGLVKRRAGERVLCERGLS
jgi:lysozyme